jgi:hypothetical protein
MQKPGFSVTQMKTQCLTSSSSICNRKPNTGGQKFVLPSHTSVISNSNITWPQTYVSQAILITARHVYTGD